MPDNIENQEPTEHQEIEMYDCEKYDRKKFNPKLDGLLRVTEKELKQGAHVRYTYNGYMENGRRSVYGVVMRAPDESGIVPMRPYKGKPGQPSWCINISPGKNKYKNYHFYMRPPRVTPKLN